MAACLAENSKMSMMSTYTKGYTNIVFQNVSNQLDFFTNIIITLCMLWLSFQYNIETKTPISLYLH